LQGLWSLEAAVLGPLGTPPLLIRMHVLAGVRLNELLGLGVMVRVSPALCTSHVVDQGGTQLALLVLGPLALWGLLICKEPLAG